MILILAAALAALPGQQVQLPKPGKEPRSVDISAKPTDALVACVVSKLAERQGYEILKDDSPAGPVINLRFRIVGVAATAASIYVQELGAERRLVIYASGRTNGAPRVFSARARECL